MWREQGVILQGVQEARDDVVEEGWLACSGVVPHSFTSNCLCPSAKIETQSPHRTTMRKSTQVIFLSNVKKLTRQHLPNTQISQGVGLGLVQPLPSGSRQSTDLSLNLLARSLGVFRVEDVLAVCLEDCRSSGGCLVSRAVRVEELVFDSSSLLQLLDELRVSFFELAVEQDRIVERSLAA